MATKVDIRTLRKNILNEVKEKKPLVNARTYRALLDKYDIILSSKKKLLKFQDDLKYYTTETNTKGKHKVYKQQLAKIKEEEVKQAEHAKTELKKLLSSKNKVVSFYATVYYKPEEKTKSGGVNMSGIGNALGWQSFASYPNSLSSNRGPKKVLGGIYYPLSYVAQGQAGSFYLSKSFSIGAEHIFAKMKKVGYITYPDFQTDVNDLKEFDGYEELNKNFEMAGYSDPDVIIIITNLQLNDESVAVDNHFADEEAFRDVTACPIIAVKEYMKYDYNKNMNLFKSQYKSKYIQENYRPNSCWASLILDVYKEPFEKYYKPSNKNKNPMKLTYETLHKIFKPDEPLKPSENGYNFNHIVKFFKLYNLGVYMLDVNLNVREYYEPQNRHKDISPNTLYVVFHDRHIYHLNHDLKRLQQKIQSHIDRRLELCKKPSNKYFIKDEETKYDMKMIESVDDVLYEMSNTTEDLHLFYDKGNCYDLWFQFVNRGIKPFAGIKNGKVDFETIRIRNVGSERDVTIHTYQEESVTHHKEFKTEEMLNHYLTKKDFASRQLISKNYMSQYSSNVKQMLDAYKSGPLIGGFREFPESNQFIQIDFNKYYTSILANLDEFPAVNSFDEFVDYKNEKLQKYNLYMVEKLVNNQSYPYHKFSLCYGRNIEGVKNIRVLAFLQMSKTKKSVSKEVVKKVYEDDKLTIKMKKDIFNHICGKYNKGENKTYFTSVTSDLQEAMTIKKENGGRIIPIQYEEEENQDKDYETENEDSDEEDEDLDYHAYKLKQQQKAEKNKQTFYINHITNTNDLNEGFRLLSLYIYDTAHKHLLDLKDKVEA